MNVIAIIKWVYWDRPTCIRMIRQIKAQILTATNKSRKGVNDLKTHSSNLSLKPLTDSSTSNLHVAACTSIASAGYAMSHIGHLKVEDKIGKPI